MSTMNPLNIESISRKSAISPELAAQLAGEEKFRKQTLDQKPIPMEKEEHLLDPWFYKCDDKIVKYDMRELGRWKVRIRISRTDKITLNSIRLLFHVLLGNCKLLVHCAIGLGHLEPSHVSHDCVLLHDVYGNHYGQYSICV